MVSACSVRRGMPVAAVDSFVTMHVQWWTATQWSCAAAKRVVTLLLQVESLMEGPSLQRDLDQQRAVIQSLSGV
jgi:hypothetical protein